MSTSGGSYFKGWASTLPNMPLTPGSVSSQEIWLGHVLDIDYNYGGKIRVRLAGTSKELNDDDVKVEAYPVDLNMIKYPLPGELVLITQGLRNQTDKGKFAIVYYYIATLSSNQNLTFNSDPYMGQSVPAKKADKIYTPEYEHRFEEKLKSKESFLEGETLRQKAPLQPYEGDFILQGRFGSSIRFGSTDSKKGNDWSREGRSVAGSPILILSARESEGGSPVAEKANEVGHSSTIFICSSQTVPVNMATSRQLKSHLVRYDAPVLSASGSDPVRFLESEVHPPTLPFMYGTDASGSQLTGIVNSGGTRSEVRHLVVHYTVGDGRAIDTVNNLATRGLGIHYCIQGDGAVARGDGGDDKIVLWHGNNLNTWGAGIEICTYGRARPVGDPETTTRFRNDYGDRYTKSYRGRPWYEYRSIVDAGFTYNNGRFWSDYTDQQIESLKRICQDTIARYPKIGEAIRGKNVWKEVFGLDQEPVYGGTYTNKKLQGNTAYGIFTHNRASSGDHTDAFPTPKIIRMFKELGMVGKELAAKRVIHPSEFT